MTGVGKVSHLKDQSLLFFSVLYNYTITNYYTLLIVTCGSGPV